MEEHSGEEELRTGREVRDKLSTARSLGLNSGATGESAKLSKKQ